jgi:hypothetical protein
MLCEERFQLPGFFAEALANNGTRSGKFWVDYREPLKSGNLTGYRICRDKMINQLLIPQCQRHRELKSVQRTQTRTRNAPPAIRTH